VPGKVAGRAVAARAGAPEIAPEMARSQRSSRADDACRAALAHPDAAKALELLKPEAEP
jgi:hypothetical protein